MHDESDVNPGSDIGLRGQALLDHIVDNYVLPDKGWEQGDWAHALEVDGSRKIDQSEIERLLEMDYVPESCGTAFCVAGYAAHLTGAKIMWRPWIRYDGGGDHEFFGWRAESVNNGESIEGYARQVLGLRENDAQVLFEGSNTAEEIDDYREKLAAGGRLNTWDNDDEGEDEEVDEVDEVDDEGEDEVLDL